MSRFHLGDFRDRARDFARSNHSSRRLVLPISRPTTVIITPRRYPESPGSSRTAHAPRGRSRHLAAHGPHYAHGRFGPGNPFSAGLNRRCITCPASSRHLHPVNVLDSARRVRGAVLILVAARARGGARARPVSRGAPRSHRGFSKTCFHGRLGARGKAHDSPPVLV